LKSVPRTCRDRIRRLRQYNREIVRPRTLRSPCAQKGQDDPEIIPHIVQVQISSWLGLLEGARSPHTCRCLPQYPGRPVLVGNFVRIFCMEAFQRTFTMVRRPCRQGRSGAQSVSQPILALSFWTNPSENRFQQFGAAVRGQASVKSVVPSCRSCRRHRLPRTARLSAPVQRRLSWHMPKRAKAPFDLKVAVNEISKCRDVSRVASGGKAQVLVLKRRRDGVEAIHR